MIKTPPGEASHAPFDGHTEPPHTRCTKVLIEDWMRSLILRLDDKSETMGFMTI